MNHALERLSALGNDKRIAIFRLLVKAAPDGMFAGEIATELGLLPNTLSAQLAILSKAGLIAAGREGRHVRYRVEIEAMHALVAWLMEDCCGGNPSLCAPVPVGLKLC